MTMPDSKTILTTVALVLATLYAAHNFAPASIKSQLGVA